MGSGIFASLVAIILDCKVGYHVFTFVGVIGFIGWGILNEKTTRETPENSPPGDDLWQK